MAATDFLWTRYPIQGADFPVKNTSGSALTAGQVVKVDTGNVIGASQPQVGVVLTSAVTDYPLGVLAENIPAGGYGRCQLEGVAVCIAQGAISAGAIVGPGAGTAGDVITYTAADPSLGQALSASANAADPILVRLSISKNA